MIAFFRGTGFLGSAIRWQTRGEYSHCGWIAEDGSFYEANLRTGVSRSRHPWILNDSPADVCAVHGWTQEHSVMLERWLGRRVGAHYDWLGVVRFLSGINRNNWDRWFCSELVAEGCAEAQCPLMLTDAWRLSPATLAWSTELVPLMRNADLGWWQGHFGKGAK